MVGRDKPGLELALEGIEEDEMGMARTVGTLLGPPPNPVGVDNPGLRRLDEDTAGLVNLEEG